MTLAVAETLCPVIVVRASGVSISSHEQPAPRRFAGEPPDAGWESRLLLIGVVAIAASTLSLGMVIDALITTRILVQSMGQIVALTLLRRNAPDMPRPFRVWWYPIPNLVALFGWILLFSTTGLEVIAFGLGTLLLGVAAFFGWAWRTAQWPFGRDTA